MWNAVFSGKKGEEFSKEEEEEEAKNVQFCAQFCLDVYQENTHYIPTTITRSLFKKTWILRQTLF